jgi:hypothetical protein
MIDKLNEFLLYTNTYMFMLALFFNKNKLRLKSFTKDFKLFLFLKHLIQ